MDEAPIEPDLITPWKRNVWVYGLRTPFSLVFLGWITLAQALSPSFKPEVYLFTLLAAFFGLVIGAHFIDITTSKEKFSPFFAIPKSMLTIGVVAVLIGTLIGVYMSIKWNIFFLFFVAAESFAAIAYPRESPRFAHSYLSFGLAWGAVPFLGAFYIQSGFLSILSIGISIFIGASVVMMHHLAIMSRDSPAWKDALFLLRLYRYSVYTIALLGLLGKLLAV